MRVEDIEAGGVYRGESGVARVVLQISNGMASVKFDGGTTWWGMDLNTFACWAKERIR